MINSKKYPMLNFIIASAGMELNKVDNYDEALRISKELAISMEDHFDPKTKQRRPDFNKDLEFYALYKDGKPKVAVQLKNGKFDKAMGRNNKPIQPEYQQYLDRMIPHITN